MKNSKYETLNTKQCRMINIRNSKPFRILVVMILNLFSISILGFSAYAQTGQAGTDFSILNAGVGARALGMGSAFTAVESAVDSPYWNPGALDLITSSEITTMQTKLSSDADHYYVSYVQKAFGGTIGVSWIQVGLGNVIQTSSEVDDHNEVQNLNIFSYYSNAYLLSYGKEINDKLSMGMTAKYLTSDMFGQLGGQASGYSLTPGAVLRFNQLTLGAKIEDIINSQTWGTGTTEKVIPKARVGIAVNNSLFGGSLFSLDISQMIRSNYSPELSAGYELSDKKSGLAFRVGYNEGNFTAGAGFSILHAKVDYAYVQQRELSKNNVQRISLSGIW